jgi:acetoin utilization deacetylase AcuC-like enzyme
VRILRTDAHRAHHGSELDAGRLIPSWECPERADLVLAALTAAGHEPDEAPPAGAPELAAVHDPGYVEFLRTAWDRWSAAGRDGDAMGFGWVPRRAPARRPDDLDGQLGWYAFAADCAITAGTWSAATAAAGLALAAAGEVGAGARAVFALCRPPGHHATADQFGGYCYLNNAALAAQGLRDAGASRVSVLDIDYHHGNGTQDIFYERGDVQVVSLHADPRQQFPWFSGYADETGRGAGAGTTVNLPLPRGTSGPAWLDALDSAVAAVEAHRPDAIVVSVGVDTYAEDPISDFGLLREHLRTAGTVIAGTRRPAVLVLEGGYATGAIGDNVAAVLEGFGDG